MRSIVTSLQFPLPSEDCGTKIDPAHTSPYCFRAISPFYSILVSFSCGPKALSLNPQVPEKNDMRNAFARTLVLQSQRWFAPAVWTCTSRLACRKRVCSAFQSQAWRGCAWGQGGHRIPTLATLSSDSLGATGRLRSLEWIPSSH